MVYSVNFLPAGALPAKVFGTKDKTLNALHRAIQPVRFLPLSHSSKQFFPASSLGHLWFSGGRWVKPQLEVKFIEAFDGSAKLLCCAISSD